MSVHKPFKTTERAIAKRLGGSRIGHLGGADIDAGWLSVECKHRKLIPSWLKDAVAQAKRNAGISQLPVAILHQQGQRHDSDLVVLTLADFQNWFRGEADGGTVADARYLAANGDEDSAAWLEVMTPDRAQE